MNLKQAFEQWSSAPRNVILASKYRDAAQRVLLKQYGDTDLTVFTGDFCHQLFLQSRESDEVKTKAASLLVYILQWGGDNGYCTRPAFDYSIWRGEDKDDGTGKKKAEKNNSILSHTETEKPEPKKEKRTAVVKGTRGSGGGRSARPFAQIDPSTLKVIKIWGHLKDAQRELGAYNLGRAVERMGKSAGYYWCDAADVDTFERRLMAKARGKKAPVLQKTLSVIISRTPAAPNEGKPRGLTKDILKHFTVEELTAELERRSLHTKNNNVLATK